MAINNWTVDIPCPRCRRKLPVTIGQLEEGVTLVCPACKLTGAEANLVRLEARLDRLGKSIHHLKRSLETG